MSLTHYKCIRCGDMVSCSMDHHEKYECIMQSCSNCFYRREARMPGQITSVSVCAFDPPKVYVLPAPNGGAQVAAFQTQVNNDQWCGKWVASFDLTPKTDDGFPPTIAY